MDVCCSRTMLPALNFEEDQGGELIWEAASRKVALLPLGRIFSTIFVAEFRDVEKSLLPENVRAHQGPPLLRTCTICYNLLLKP